MKKVTHLLLAAGMLASFGSATAQSVLMSETFEGSGYPPAGWITLDADGDGRTWQLSADASFSQSGTSRQIAISFARNPNNYNDVYPAQDNWLITPEFEVKNASVTIEFEYCAQDIEKSEPLEVLVSEGGTAATDFSRLWNTTAENGYDDYNPVVQSKKIGLTAYEGKRIRVAFRHKTSGSYGLSIDNVTVNNQQGPQTPKWYEATPDPNGGNSVYLKWLNPSKNGNGDDLTSVSVNIYRNGTLIHTESDMAAGSDGEWTDTSVLQGKYSYTLTAFTDQGETRRITAKNVQVGEDYPAAVAMSCALAKGNSAVLSWEAVTKGANSTASSPTVFNPANVRYIVKRIDANGSETTLAGNLEATTYTDADLEDGKTYNYNIQATNSAGTSEVLDMVSVYIAPAGVSEIAVAQTSERVNRSERVAFDTTDEFDVTQTIYFPDELQFVRGDISSLVWKIYGSTSLEINMPVRIYLSETEKTDFEDKEWAAMTNAVKVFEGTINMRQGSNDYLLTFDTPYDYKGGNLVVTAIKDGKPNGKYSDCFYTVASPRGNRSMVTSTYSKVDAASLPHSSYGDKATSFVPSIRLMVDAKGVGSLSGKVTDNATGAPLPGVNLEVTSLPGLSATSDASGSYNVPFIPAGTHTVKASVPGYNDTEFSVEIADGTAATKDAAMVQLPHFTLSGTVKAGDTGLPAEGAEVRLSGYEEVTVSADSNGSWSIPAVYTAQDYTLEISYPLYDTFTKAIRNESEEAVDEGEIALTRSLIPPFAVNTEVASDGSAMQLRWNDPLARTGEPGEKSIGNVDELYSTGGDWSLSDYCIAHQFLPADLEAKKMTGLSFAAIKVYIKADGGTFTAHIWEGTRDDHTVLASAEIPASEISADGAWVTVAFSEPVEIKAGRSYMAGVHCSGYEGSSTFGTAPSANRVNGQNDVKFSDTEYAYNSYSPWCIITDCRVPASPAGIAQADNIPRCSYNIYRAPVNEAEAPQWEKINSTPTAETTFSDSGWNILGSGKFIYGVSAVYQNGESLKALSDAIARSNDCDVAVTAFTKPLKSTQQLAETEVEVTITNLGEKPVENIPVTLTVNGEQKASVTYSGSLNKGDSATLPLGSVTLGDDTYMLVAATALEGDENPSNDAASLPFPNKANVELTAYRWSAYGNAGFMKVQSNNPEGADFRKEFTTDEGLLIAAEYLNGKIYAYTATWYQAPREFIAIDPVTWTITEQSPNDDHFILDMAYNYDDDTMYALEPAADNDVCLMTVNLDNGATTPVGLLGQVVRSIACDLKGNLYGMAASGELLKINTATGATTPVGDTGFGAVVYLQSMCFDHNSGRLFWAATSDDTMGRLYEIDPATAKAALFGDALFNGSEESELIGLHTPYTKVVSVGSTVATDTSISVSIHGTAAVVTPEAVTATVYNTLGTPVAAYELNEGSNRLQLNLLPGAYLMQLSNGLAHKFVIR